jgi:ERCC4-type nuclease
MFIKIDYREKELQEKILFYISNIPSFKNLKVLTENLPIGDIIICNNNEDILIIERKTVADLLSSIKDGRYEEQSFRLNGNTLHNHNIMYLIEGDINKMNMFRESKFEKLTLYSAIFSLNYYKGFSVIRTFNLDETALFICNCTMKLMKGQTVDRKGFYSNKSMSKNKIEETMENVVSSDNLHEIEDMEENITSNSKEDKNYISVVKKTKKENITTDNIDEIMLCQIPGISTNTAIHIIEKFKTIVNLIKSLEENANCLNDICYTNNKGQTRKITKTSITNLIKFLLKK